MVIFIKNFTDNSVSKLLTLKTLIRFHTLQSNLGLHCLLMSHKERLAYMVETFKEHAQFVGIQSFNTGSFRHIFFSVDYRISWISSNQLSKLKEVSK